MRARSRAYSFAPLNPTGVVSFLLMVAIPTALSAQVPIPAIPSPLGVSTQGQFALVDVRPAADLKFSMGSAGVLSCNYMVVAFGEEQAPGRIARLERDLKAQFGDRLNGHTIAVSRYSI